MEVGNIKADLKALPLQCPYCGETIEVLIDTSFSPQEYIEDCEVCCRPITICVQSTNGNPQVDARREDD